jgi:hypothetical protein
MVNRAADLRPNARQIDPDVKIPDAVKRAAAAAEAAHAAAYGKKDAPAPDPDTPPADTIKIEEPPAPQPPPGTVTSAGNEPAPQPAPDAPQPPPPKTTIPDAGAGDTFETRYKAEYGRRMQLKNTVDQMLPRMTLLENKVEELMTENAQLRTSPTTTAPLPTATELITDKDREEFGPEMIGLMERVVQAKLAPLEQLRQTTQSLADRLQGTTQAVAKNARADMLAKLDSALPQWRDINFMDEYKAWLALPDPYSGAIRQGMLTEAFEQNDTPRVLQFFKGFVSEVAATAPADNTAPAPPAPVVQPTKPNLGDLAAPGRARQTAGGPPSPAEKQIITTADIAAFYADIRAGKYRGREAEQNANEQELFAAQREGRVVHV